MSCDGCGPFLFRVVAMINAGLHIDSCIHWLKLNAAGTGLKSSGQENDRAPVFPHFKKDIHTRDRRYCELFLKKDPLARTDMDVLMKARLYITHTHACTHAHTHICTCTLSHSHNTLSPVRSLTCTYRSFWEPFLLGNSTAVNSVAELISGVNPKFGFRFKKKNPLLRLVYIHTENRHVTFSRKSIYAGLCECMH